MTKFKIEAMLAEKFVLCEGHHENGTFVIEAKPKTVVGWVELDVPVVNIPGFRSPIPKATLKELEKKIVKKFGKIQSLKVTNLEEN